MKLTELLIADIERDAETTRRALARVPINHDSWKPHDKSMQLGYLVYMVATMVEWVDFIVNRNELDIAPKDGGKPPVPEIKSNDQLLEMHKAALDKAISALRHTTDEHLMTDWKLLAKGKVVIQAPRHVMIRDTVINHLAHHRGQLTVYLRLLSASVPALYGPSADEGKEWYA
ncbi:MAG TPA: DinB family protein [Candidatus Koribacter sp.]|jgi:uncharacterized damage-inducible protein DinB